MLLAGDVGGSKTKLGVFSRKSGPRAPITRATLVSAEYASLEALCRSFLARADLAVRHASLGVPGPVVNGRATTTNLPWEIDELRLREGLGFECVTLFNDLVAVAFALPELEPRELHTISAGEADPYGNVAVIAPGTGLGEAFASYESTGCVALASEGGHVDFAPTTALQEGLLSFLKKRYDHVSYERVCSGIGIPNIYDYLKEIEFAEEPAWLANKLAKAKDRTPPILKAALDAERSCELCEKTLELFVTVLGAKAGNLALTTLATGGVYIGGGIPPRILPALTDGTFAAAFKRKGRLRPFLEGIPVHVICNPDAPLLGAAFRGLELLNP